MGWKIPTLGDGVGAVIGYIPRLIKKIKDNARAKNVDKIEDAVFGGDDKYINQQLRKVIDEEERRRKANS